MTTLADIEPVNVKKDNKFRHTVLPWVGRNYAYVLLTVVVVIFTVTAIVSMIQGPAHYTYSCNVANSCPYFNLPVKP